MSSEPDSACKGSCSVHLGIFVEVVISALGKSWP